MTPTPPTAPSTAATTRALGTLSLPVVALGDAGTGPAIDAAKPKQTTAGNYFVANYPPFSFWTAEHVPQAIRTLQSPPPMSLSAQRAGLGVYVHIPFCRKRCHFCYFRVYTDKNAAEVRQYIASTLAELRLYAQQPAIAGRKPTFIYFGGGTPSYLSAEQLSELVAGMKEILPWDDVQEVTFEAEPGTLNEKKMHAIAALGVTRLSLGVENFDDTVLSSNGRAHLSRQVYAAYGWARAAKFRQINIDLIAGMLNETDANWSRCIEQTLALAPDCVTIYQMEVPFNTTIYKQMKEQGQITAPVADWDTKRRWVSEAFAALEGAGYRVTSAYTAVRDPANFQFVYRDQLWTGADLIGLGVASFGHIAGVHLQNEHHWDPYLERLARQELPILRALPMTTDERLIRELILQLKTGRVSMAYFRDKFGVRLGELFAAVLQSLQDEGTVQTFDVDNELTLTREALLRVDTLLERFFLPQHQHSRYA